jgi:AP-1 complex subunit gamma-1
MSTKKEQPTKLRDLIRAVRACKTAAEERSVVADESAKIRESFRDESCKYRHRSVAKLLFIQMMGYATEFGQVECLRLIVSSNFTEKRVGYLGLTQLLNETTDVLMMVTNSIRQDIINNNTHVTGLALTALANVGTADMCRDLAENVKHVLEQSSSYLKKKAALAAVRIVRKCPELTEMFASVIPALIEERNHGVVLTGVTLLHEILKNEPGRTASFTKYLLNVVRMLRNLLLSGYSPEHDISGVTDPFLQVKLIKTLFLLGRVEHTFTDDINDCLAQLTNNTDTAKNTGNAILYECVKTIMGLKVTGGVRMMAVNTMGRFLLHRDNNLRYVALKTLQQFVDVDADVIQRHKNTIISCLKDNDASIRKKALELTFTIINDTNIKQIVKEMLNYLLTADNEFKEELVRKICTALDLHSPNKRWHVDTAIKVLSLAGNYVPEEVVASLVHLISGTSEIQAYATHKLYFSMKENLEQSGLVLLGVWCIGEFGNLLIQGNAIGPDEKPISVNEGDVCSLFEDLMKNDLSESCKEYVLTALIKMSVRLPNSTTRIIKLLSLHTQSLKVELQQRACEFIKLLDSRWDAQRGPLLEKMPALKKTVSKEVPIGEIDIPNMVDTGYTAPSTSVPNLLDLDLLLDTPVQTVTQEPAKPMTEVNILDIFGGSLPVSAPAQATHDFGNEFEDFQAPTEHHEQVKFVAYEDAEVLVSFVVRKPDPDMTISMLDALIANKTDDSISDLKFQAAGQKHFKLQLFPASSSFMPGHGQITQSMRITNSAYMQKPVVLRIKLDFAHRGEKKTRSSTVSNFPSNI